MNRLDALSKLILAPYLLALPFLEGVYALAVSLLVLLVGLNIDFWGRGRLRVVVRPVWLMPLSFTLLYLLPLFLVGLVGPNIFYLALALFLVLFFGGELEGASRLVWLYLLNVVVVFGLVALLGLGSYVFFVATPLIDFLWFEGVAGREALDRVLSAAPIVLMYWVVAPAFLPYVLVVNAVRCVLDGLQRSYLFMADFYLRLVVGWLVGLGY